MKRLSSEGRRLSVYLALLVVLVGFPVAYLSSRHPKFAEAAWFDNSWGFRQRLDISNSSGSTQTNFQVQITYDSATPITAGKMQSACQDIRFTDVTGKVLPYWIEPTTCNTSTSKIWVKVPSISTSGIPLYIYYGNASASPAPYTTSDVFVRDMGGVVASWNLDEAAGAGSTLADSSGAGLSATANLWGGGNISTDSAHVAGKYGNAFSFDGGDDELKVNDNSALDGFSAMSIFFWANPSSNRTAEMVIKHMSTTSDINWEVYQAGLNIAGRINGASVTCTTSGNVFTTGSWHFVGMVWDGTQINMYIDGASVNTTCSRVTTMSNSIGNLSIGRYEATTSNYPFSGLMDNIRLYNRALNQAEITDIYGTAGSNQGYVTTNYVGKELVRQYATGVSVGAPATEETGSGPVAYWKFDDGTGTTAKDSSPNTNDTTLAGATLPTWQAEDQCLSGKCLFFDGVTSRVGRANTSSLNISGSNITVSVWFKAQNLSASSGLKMLLTKGAYGVHWNYGLGFNNNNLLMRHNGSDDTSTAVVVTNNTWHQFTGVYSGTTDYFYYDGILVDTKTSSGGQNVGTQVLTVGASYTSGTSSYSEFFGGFIDEIRIYSYARSTAQVQSDYNARGGSGSTLGVSTQIGQQTTAALNNGLLGYWKMDEATGSGNTLADASGNGNTLNATLWGGGNTSTDSAHPPGRFGNAFSFDGGDDYLDRGGGLSGTVAGAGLTVSAWIYPTSLSGTQRILTANPPVFLALNGNKLGDPTYVVYASSAWHGALGNTILTVNTWQHVAITYDGTTLSLYVNGVLDTSVVSPGTIASGTGCFIIGAYNNGGCGGGMASYFHGNIDEVRYYKRALSSSEIGQLYAWAPGPVAYWKLDEHTGTTVNDSSGNNINSTSFTGSPTWTSGKFGSGLAFGGTSQSVNFGNVLGISGNLSMSAWVKWNQFKNWGVILQRGTGGGVSASNYSIWSYSDHLACYAANGGASTTVSYSTLPSTGQWHHIECTLDGVNFIMYIDGVQVALASQTLVPAATAGTALTISEPTYTIDGSVDDVRIYNYARSSGQVAEDMNGGHPVGGSPIGSQLLYWKFNEGFGTTVHDSSPNGNNGTYSCASASTCVAGISSWTTSGKFDKAYYFNPTLISDRPYFSHAPINISSTVGTAMTWTLWVNPNATQVGGGWMFRNGNGLDENYGISLSGPTGGKYKVVFQGYDTTFRSVSTTNFILPASQWSHLAIVYSQGQWLKFYVNGAFIEQVTWPYAATVPATTEFDLGGNSGAYQNYNGYIDEFKIYNAELTASQIKMDFNAAASINYGTGTVEAANLSDGAGASPAAYFDFEEHSGTAVNDKSGNGNTGTWNGTGSHWTTGQYGSSGNFGGTNDYVSTGNSTILNSLSKFTLSGWVKINSYSAQEAIISTYGGSNLGVLLEAGLTSNDVLIAVNDGATNPYGYTATGIYTPGTWHYWSTVFDGTQTGNSNRLKFYLDGVQQALTFSGTIPASTTATSGQNLTLGARNTSQFFLNGQLDEVKIYNYARTPAQVAYDYNRGAPVGWWKMDECQGGTAHDSSGKANDGTITIGGTGTQTSAGTCTTAGTAWGNGATGKFGASLNFDGTDDYIAVPQSDYNIGGDVTISSWFKTTSVAQRPIFSNRNGTGARLYYGITSGKTFIYFDASSPPSIVGTKTISDNTWHHFVYVRSGTTTTVYVDGVLDASATQTGYTTGPHAMRIGSDVANGEYFPGQIDDVRIYNYALSVSQVQTVYNGGAAVKYSP